MACISVWAFIGLSMYNVERHSTSNPVSHMAQTTATRKGCSGFLNADSTSTRFSPTSKPCFIRTRCGMMSKCHFFWVEIRLGDGVGDPIVEIEPSQAQLLAAVLVDKLHRGAVLLGPFEVIARDVGAEDALSQVVVLEQRRASEADERRVRQRQ